MNTLLWSATAPAKLLASRRYSGGEIVFPAVPAHSPLADQHESLLLDGEGTVYSYTVIHPSPKSGLQPFALAYLDLPGPVRLFGRIRGTRRPAIGDKYQVLPDDEFGYAFELSEDAQ